MRFDELQLSDYILDALNEQGFTEATEIQALTIPLIKEGKDTLGLSQTGSGKTYAFGIPAIEAVDPDEKSQQILVVCPTRELANQSTEELRKLTEKKEGIKIVPVFGGASMERQIQAIRKNAKIVVGTPGRLMDHLRRKTLKLDRIKMIILDEADEMLNMGFREDIETILKASNDTHQTVMFSATMPKEILNITKEYMKDPITVKSSVQDNPQEFIDQFFVQCQRDKKFDTLLEIYQKKQPKTSIIFCNTKRMTDNLATKLNDSKVTAVCIHGDMRQSARKKVMDEFKANGGILVATDVAARGIDVKNVDIVVNFDFPSNPDYYVHRIGRTARAGKEGMAITLINNNDQLKDMNTLMRDTKNQIKQMHGFSSDLVYSKSSQASEEGGYSEKRGMGRRKPSTSSRKKQNTISIKEFEAREEGVQGRTRGGFGKRGSAIRFGDNMYGGKDFAGKSDKPIKDAERAERPRAYGEGKSGERAERPRAYGEGKSGERAERPRTYGADKIGERAERPRKAFDSKPRAQGNFQPSFEIKEGEGAKKATTKAPYKKVDSRLTASKPYSAKRKSSFSKEKTNDFDLKVKRKQK